MLFHSIYNDLMVQKAGDHNLECMKRRDKLQTSICEFLIHQPHTIYVCYIYNVSFYGKLAVGKYLSFMDAVLSEKKVFCLAKIPRANGRNPSGMFLYIGASGCPAGTW